MVRMVASDLASWGSGSLNEKPVLTGCQAVIAISQVPAVAQPNEGQGVWSSFLCLNSNR